MSEKPIVTVKEGKVRGIKKKSTFSDTEYYSFFGIPYAKPPVERLRFKDPVKVKPWKDVYDATVQKEGCIQYYHLAYKLLGSEDCLYNNIHTLKLPSKNEPLKPVIVLIHPGAHMYGAPENDRSGSPDFFINHDVVYVGVAFRLHILGNLNLGLKECSGNQALKDIILALRWIKENIHSFNGDPDNITLLGSSSAANTIQTLMLSPHAEGLFHKAVMMGLYLFANTTSDGNSKEDGFEFGRQLGFQGDDPKKLLEFLRKIPCEDLVIRLKSFKKFNPDWAPIYSRLPFIPEEGDLDGVIPKNIRKRIPHTMRIPLMFGLCEHEAVLGLIQKWKHDTYKNFRKSYRQNRCGWMRNLSDAELDAINLQIDDFYLKNCSKDDIPVSILENILTDATFSDLYGSLIDIIAADLPESVYVYKFEYDGLMTLCKSLHSNDVTQELKGTFHGTDFCYWAQYHPPRSGEVANVIKMFTKLICTFAKNGNPNYEGIEEPWRPTTPQHPCHMRINTTLKMVDGRLNHERMEFWRTIMEQFKKE